jgi:hypothetical protein
MKKEELRLFAFDDDSEVSSEYVEGTYRLCFDGLAINLTEYAAGRARAQLEELLDQHAGRDAGE